MPNHYFGARPLKRAIQRELQDPLALAILAGEFHEDDLILLDREGEALMFLPVVQAYAAHRPHRFS